MGQETTNMETKSTSKIQQGVKTEHGREILKIQEQRGEIAHKRPHTKTIWGETKLYSKTNATNVNKMEIPNNDRNANMQQNIYNCRKCGQHIEKHTPMPSHTYK